MKFLAKVALIVIALALVLAVIVLSQLMVRHAPTEIDYNDLLIIVLTVLSIMITVLGLGLAVVGVIGWATFEAKLKDNSFKYFANELGKDGQLRREFEALLTEISLRGVEPVGSDKAEGPISATGVRDGEDKDYVD
jgi:hypothetical protein